MNYFVDRTSPRNLRYWTERSGDQFVMFYDEVPASPYYGYLKLKQNMQDHNIRSLKIKYDSVTISEIHFTIDGEKEIINISQHDCKFVSFFKYCPKNITIIYEENDVYAITGLSVDSIASVKDELSGETVFEHFYLDSYGNLIHSITTIIRDNQPPEKTTNNFYYNESGQMTMIKSLINDTIIHILEEYHYRDSIVQYVNGVKRKKFYISELNFLSRDEKLKLFSEDFIVVDKLDYYDFVDDCMNTIVISPYPQIFFYNGWYMKTIIEFHPLYFLSPDDWIRMHYFEFDRLHPKTHFGYRKTYSSPEYDIIVYLYENLITKKSGLIDIAKYRILTSGLYDFKLMTYEFNYEYEFFE